MDIVKNSNGTSLNIALIGRLDTITAPALDKELKESLPGVENLAFDFSKLEYISSAGLRILLGAQKVMNKQGSMTLSNINGDIMEVLEITGFSDILTII